MTLKVIKMSSNIKVKRILILKNLRRIICGLLILTALSTWAQGINYKALIKDGSGNVIVNQSITVQFQILRSSKMLVSMKKPIHQQQMQMELLS